MPDVVGQLVELAHAPVGQAGPAAGADAARVVVKLLSIAHEEVDEQEQHDKGGHQQVADGHPPVRAGHMAFANCCRSRNRVEYNSSIETMRNDEEAKVRLRHTVIRLACCMKVDDKVQLTVTLPKHAVCSGAMAPHLKRF